MITIETGSILDFKGDCIVNPANSFLRHGAGLAKIIADAATALPQKPPNASVAELHEWSADCDRRRMRGIGWWKEQHAHALIPTGGAGWTSAAALPYKGIVHAVGPIWGGGGYYEAGLLRTAHRSALITAWLHGCRSVAFPAISCGIFGYPAVAAAECAIEGAVYTAATRTMDVAFYPFGFEAEYEAALAARS